MKSTIICLALVLGSAACGGGKSTPTEPTPQTPKASLTLSNMTVTSSAISGGYRYSVSFTIKETMGGAATLTAIDFVFSSGPTQFATAHIDRSETVAANAQIGSGVISISDTIAGHPAATYVVATLSYRDANNASSKVAIAGDVPKILVVPIIDSFSADSSSVDPGQTTTLRWSITGATSASINNGVGSVSATGGSMVVTPQSFTTVYQLTATNADGNATKTVSVGVRYPDVEYRVTTSAAPRVSLITYAGPNGSTLQAGSPSTPWSYTFSASTGSFLYVSAQNDNFNTCVTVSILKQGSSYRSGTSCGAFTIATVSGER